MDVRPLGDILCLEVPLTPLNNYIASQAGTWEPSPSIAPTPLTSAANVWLPNIAFLSMVNDLRH
jgi:hypothetical protein